MVLIKELFIIAVSSIIAGGFVCLSVDIAVNFVRLIRGKKPEPFINTVDAVGSLMASVKALDKRTRGLGMAKPRRAKAGAAAWR